ncbi:hypothetical protein [Teredinibacter sp. KSP-S5-2]|uniref:hypothetical protein n=1 Tax=Teredinibacter sp. KSP-S5-2 TaxID=3034506 RepID=UPI002934D4EA|nr:hypothetical protein [Teredinibacter sp. KSP-S5-2]WNO11609.1 hypothetical protein P5V12_10545 [Teredinibacter sp. KSP-S5-2]
MNVNYRDSIKIVFYGINGHGLGHISRLLNIGRILKELCISSYVKPEFIFLTTSEASHIANEFPVYKIPTIQNINSEDLVANTRFFISNLFGAFRPDIVVMDTFPAGSFNEFLMFKDFCKKRVFVNRHTKDSKNQSNEKTDLLGYYDLILTPDKPDNNFKYSIPDKVKYHKFTDTIHGFRPELSLSREKTRDYFGISDDEKLIYVSAGGGGDKEAYNQIDTIISSFSKSQYNYKFIVGYGPLYNGKIHYKENVIPYTGYDIRRFFNGLDGAVCAAGYNTYEELLAARVPTAFYAQEKGTDRQDLRIKDGNRNGWNEIITDINNLDELTTKVFAILNNPSETMPNLKNRPRPNGALNSATEILKLYSMQSKSYLDTQAIYFVAQLYKAWSNTCNYHDIKYSDLAITAIRIQKAILGTELWSDLCEQCFIEHTNQREIPINQVKNALNLSYSALQIGNSYPGIKMDSFVNDLEGFFRKTKSTTITLNHFSKFIEERKRAHEKWKKHTRND